MIRGFSFQRCIVIGTVALLMLSCGKSSNGPVQPVLTDSTPIAQSQAANGKALWGLWDIAIDTGTGSVEAVPLRGAEFTANVTIFLQPPMGSLTYLKFTDLDLTDWPDLGIIELDVGLTHPFPGLDMYTGFDVLGVFRHNGSYASGYDAAATWGEKGVDGVLLNADGHTRWFNRLEFPSPTLFGYVPGAIGSVGFEPDATLNAFKYFADGLDVEADTADFYSDPANAERRGCFRAGSTNKRHYVLQFPMDGGSPVLHFQYGIIASWAAPPPEAAPEYAIEDFPLTANSAEPIVLAVDASESVLYYVDESNKGDILSLEIEILDHQAAANPSGVTGELAGIVVEAGSELIPGGNQVIGQDMLDSVSAPGGPSSSVYSIDIPNCEPGYAGELPILITVLSADPTDYDSGFNHPYPEGAALASYWVGHVQVDDTAPSMPPVAGELSLYWECPGDPCSGQLFTVEISEAYDPEGEPVTITWDFDGNMDFADDMDGDDTNLSGEYVYDTPGTYDAYCRVDDGTLHTDVGPLMINVMDCIPDEPEVVSWVPAPTVPYQHISYDVAHNPDDGYAYCAVSTGSSGKLVVVDVDPTATAEAKGDVDFSYLQCAIACKGSYAYIGGVYINGISTVDCSDPDNPVEVHNYQQGLSNAMINDMEVVNDYLYAAAQWGGILVFDITDPSTPQFVGQTPGGFGTVINSSAVAVTPDNQWGFYTDGYEVNPDYDDYVKVVDLSDPSSPTVVHEVLVHYHFYSDMAIQGDYLYLHEDNYFSVFDISDPETMDFVFMGTGLGGRQYDIAVSGSYAYLVKGIWGSGTLTILDISNPELPTVFTTLSLPGGGQGVNEYCGEVYVAASYNTLDIVDLY